MIPMLPLLPLMPFVSALHALTPVKLYAGARAVVTGIEARKPPAQWPIKSFACSLNPHPLLVPVPTPPVDPLQLVHPLPVLLPHALAPRPLPRLGLLRRALPAPSPPPRRRLRSRPVPQPLGSRRRGRGCGAEAAPPVGPARERVGGLDGRRGSRDRGVVGPCGGGGWARDCEGGGGGAAWGGEGEGLGRSGGQEAEKSAATATEEAWGERVVLRRPTGAGGQKDKRDGDTRRNGKITT